MAAPVDGNRHDAATDPVLLDVGAHSRDHADGLVAEGHRRLDPFVALVPSPGVHVASAETHGLGADQDMAGEWSRRRTIDHPDVPRPVRALHQRFHARLFPSSDWRGGPIDRWLSE